MGQELIRLTDVSKSYYSAAGVTQALRMINLSFQQGEFVAVTGESGSGKSTLLSVIGGILPFDDGEMTVYGDETFKYDAADWEEYRRNRIGFVFQDYSLVGHFTVLENVVTGMLARGIPAPEAEKKAESYLALTGLSELASHKASELSSGQKQRLSIARAIAKETGIILADEPTGNLDADTGEEIMKLLSDLSKDRLVIMVTHNREQALRYVTREIRINDGQVVADTKPCENAPDEGREAAGTADVKSETHAEPAEYIARHDLLNDKGRIILFFAFMLVMSLLSSVLIMEIAATNDDIYTRNYTKDAFPREDATRLVVKRNNGKEFDEESLKALKKIWETDSVDTCDYANDFNYYLKQGEDYEFLYSVRRHQTGDDEIVRPDFKKNDNFVRSITSLSKKDIAAGKITDDMYGIIIDSSDESLIGEKYTMYFRDDALWGADEYACADLTVTGITGGNSGQAYFSEKFSDMLGAHMDSGKFRLYYNWNNRNNDYDNKNEFIPVIAPDLTGNEVRLSGRLGYSRPQGELPFHFIDETGADSEEKVNVLTEGSRQSAKVMEVSSELFNRYYKASHTQASLYIKSYAYTDKVLKKLSKKGFTGVSTYRVSMGSYDMELVKNRMLVRLICFGGLIIIFLMAAVIFSRLLRFYTNEYRTLNFIGIRMSTLVNAVTYENELLAIAGYFFASLLIAIPDRIEFISTGRPYAGTFVKVIELIYITAISLAGSLMFMRHVKRGVVSGTRA